MDPSHKCLAAVVETPELWHCRLGHPSHNVMKTIGSLNLSFENKVCDACMRGKQTREVFSINYTRAFEAFEMIHCDVWGPYRTQASCGSRYFLTVVDDYFRAVWIYLMREKNEVGQILKNFLAMAKLQFKQEGKIIRTDNGTEFQCMKKYFLGLGIIFQTSCVDTPQQNGRVERKHRHILNVERSLRFHAHLPIQFWGEYILTAGYLINRLPSPLLHGKTPCELLFGKAPLYNQLRVFGCLCYASNINRSRDKFESRIRKCVFLTKGLEGF
ncbi:unnamed protein product [Cuscuta europaea]|uniref:Integrase catalytic domain-containing protein n=1 Tax=Cuscuta europaea TaxID=41803 RepID=A0A9P0ZHT4_CUSEU|nr:unnamed protein product [Cuscuta europaea]